MVVKSRLGWALAWFVESLKVVVMIVCGGGRVGYVLPFSAFVFELGCVAAYVCCHTSSV
jgi:hypothetical protein